MIAETQVAFEARVLCAILDKPEKIADLVGVLEPEHFLPGRNRLWYEAMLACSGRGEPVEIATLGAELARNSKLVEAGGYSALAEIMQEAYLHTAHLDFYVREILSESRRKRVAEIATRVGAGERLDDDLLAELHAEIAPKKPKRESLGDLARSLAQRSAAGLSLDEGALLTPWHDLNESILGLAPGTLTLVAARPGRGKTVFLTDVAKYAAEKEHPVLFFSLEMNREGICSRLLASLSSVDHARIRKGWLAEDHRSALLEAADRIGELPLELDDQGALSIQKMRALAKSHKEHGGLALIVVDYAQLASDPKAERRIEEMAAVSRGLKEMAKELRVPVLAAVQLNRAGDGEAPRLSHIRECGQFEQDADTVLFLWMDEKYEHAESPEIEVWVMKNRQGPGKRVALQFQKNRCRMVSVVRAEVMT